MAVSPWARLTLYTPADSPQKRYFELGLDPVVDVTFDAENSMLCISHLTFGPPAVVRIYPTGEIRLA